ncbi:MAG: porin [Pseudomonadota bacterium]
MNYIYTRRIARRALNIGLYAGLLALGCASSAGAQSNTSVYGLLDLNLGATSDFTSDHHTVARVSSGGMNTSRLGFRGSEDLGAGLRAVFQLEVGLQPDTGGADAALFKRQANVGLEGAFGRVVVGRSFTTVYDFIIKYDPMGYAPFYSWAPSGSASGVSKYGMATAFDNMVKYAGKAGDFTFGASYGAGEQGGSAADDAKASLGMDYAAGSWSTVATWDRVNGTTVAATGRRDAATAWHAGTMYSAGPLKIQLAARDYRLAAGKAATPAVRARLYWTGASYVLTPADTLTGAVYYQDVRNVAAAADADPVMYVVRLRHALSRRTDLYLAAAHARTRQGAPVSVSRDDPGFGDTQHGFVAGIQHRF